MELTRIITYTICLYFTRQLFATYLLSSRHAEYIIQFIINTTHLEHILTIDGILVPIYPVNIQFHPLAWGTPGRSKDSEPDDYFIPISHSPSTA